MEYGTFKEALFAKAKEQGFTDFEMFYTSGKSFMVRVFGGEINEYKNTESEGVSFRGTYNGRVGYAYTEKMGASLIDGLVANAAGNAGIIEEEEIERLYPGDENYPQTDNFNEALGAVTAETKIETTLAMEKYALGLDPRVVSVDYCVLGTDEGSVRIANSYGLDLQNRINVAYAYVLTRVVEDGMTKTGMEVWYGRDLASFDYKALAQTAVDRALSYLGAASAPTGEYTIAFDNRTAVDILSCFAGVFYAEDAQKGFSLLAGKTGEQIASDLVTLRDDGVCDKSLMSVSFDSEGVASQNKAVIENGVLKTLLYNVKSANKEGIKSTGNGVKGSFRSSVGTTHTNFYFQPSEMTLDEMIKEVGQGIYVTELAGLHSGADKVSGDFSFSADGFMIEDGRLGKPLEQITVAGNFFDMLKNITAVANNLRFANPGPGGMVGMPSFTAKGLRISGL